MNMDHLQNDQDTEFKDLVKTVCETLNARIIKSSAYSPQTQENDKRSHRTWNEKTRFDLLNCDKELNWLESPAVYQQLYDESPHSSLGMATPFEVYFGREPNRVKFRISLAERKDLEVPEEDEPNLQELSPVKKSKLQEWKKQRDCIREGALKASNKATHKK